MLSIYIFAAVLGAGLLAISMFGGQGDVGDALDADIDTGLEGKAPGWKHALSFQTMAYVLAGFGLTGTALRLLGAPGTPTFIAAAAMGLFGGTLVGIGFGWLRRSQGGFGESSDDYIGGIGQTEVRIPSGGRGRIALIHRGHAFTLPAVSTTGEIARNEPVIVIDVVDGVAVVERAPKELTL
jgi:hypothetical protein